MAGTVTVDVVLQLQPSANVTMRFQSINTNDQGLDFYWLVLLLSNTILELYCLLNNTRKTENIFVGSPFQPHYFAAF